MRRWACSSASPSKIDILVSVLAKQGAIRGSGGTCHTLSCDHIHKPAQLCSPAHTTESVWIASYYLCVSVHVSVHLCVFHQCRFREVITFIFPQFECCCIFWTTFFIWVAMFTLITDQSLVFLSHCQKGLAGYLWLQAIRTLSKPVFINLCFNSWLISAVEIQGRPLSEEQFSH